MLKAENSELNLQINSYDKLYRLSKDVDSLRQVEIIGLRQDIKDVQKQLEKTKKANKRWTWATGALGVITVILATVFICQ